MAAPATLGLKQVLKEAFKTRSGMVAAGMLVALISTAIIVPIFYPFDVVRKWGDAREWLDNPRVAPPEWVELFAGKSLPRTIILDEDDFIKTRVPFATIDLLIVDLRTAFPFRYDVFPSELTLKFNTTFQRSPQVSVTWLRPDGLNVTLYVGVPRETIRVSRDASVISNIRNWALAAGAEDRETLYSEVTLFAEIGEGMMDPARAKLLKGTYGMRIEMVAFDLTADINARAVVYGQVYGPAGTDTQRRDLMIGLLWGAPVALAFGIVAAVVVVMVQALLGAAGAYYGRIVDESVQRLSEFLLIIPGLPILILIGLLYQPSIWALLYVVILLGVAGATTKVVRSIVLQVKEELYVESAKSYGLSRGRILMKHILPRAIPYTFSLIALSVPAFIFLEASISFLGLGDPVLPTWGRTLGEAYRDGALFYGMWWWVTLPIAGILFTTVAFALLGYAFDKIVNPRLREE